jgi:SRSO17 transposase
MRWVAGDEVYGDSTALRDTVSAHNKLYVLTVPNNTLIWLVRPTLADAQREKDNRPRSQPPVTEGIELATTVRAAVAAWPETRWQRLTVADGAKGPRTYDWACQRVVESRDRLPGPDAWLLARRSLTDATDIAYYLSNASVETPLLTLAQVAATRYTVEQCLEEAKGETGLDEYEVRYWHSWYRHVTLSMMAHAWLASIRYKAMVQKGGLNPT